MLKHYLLVALRNIKRNINSFVINIVGLSAGLASVILILLWVNDEYNFDKFHTNSDRIYQVMEKSTEGGKVLVTEATQGPLSAALKSDIPEVEKSALVFSLAKEGFLFTIKANDKILKSSGVFAGKDFFQIFSFPLLAGDAENVLKGKDAIVLSKSTAEKLFGSVDKAIGQAVDFEITGMKRAVQVSGVCADVPLNSTLQFDFALGEELLLTELWKNGNLWTNEGPSTYVLLKPAVAAASFDQKIAGLVKKYSANSQFDLFSRKYSNAYLYGNYENGVQSGGRIEYVKLFTLIAIIILLVACINFMNLATARASKRLKEVGVKKVMGMSRTALAFQFLTEAVLIVLVSAIIAVVLVLLILPFFNNITFKNVRLDFDLKFFAALGAVTLITGLLAGSYPALYLSKFNPITVLKGKIQKSFGESFARNGLVLFQFSVSLILMVSVIVVHRQLNFIQNKNLGYNKENVIYFDKEGKLFEESASFLTELRKISGVLNASVIGQNIVKTQGNSSTYGIDWPGKTEKDLVNFIIRPVDTDMLETLGVGMKEGRTFQSSFGNDSANIIFNETAIKMMGIKDPIGKTVSMWGKPKTIVGVVKDFHISSLHEAISPMLFYFEPNRTAVVMARIGSNNQAQTIASIEKLFKSFNPGYVFDYKFLDQTYQSLYVSERTTSQLSNWFTCLALMISFLGLFGLAAFNAETRTKEIGVRKVLGASVSNLFLLLSKGIFKLVLISVLIAFQVSWWMMNKWLNNYAYKVSITADVFLIASISILVLTLLAISTQAIKAAVANPIKSLRTE